MQSVNFGETIYNWSNIPDYLTSYNLDVETLCYHCGVSVEMQYGTHGSGAYSDDVLPALENYFGYSQSMQFLDKGNYSENDWDNILKTELNNGRPIHYSGYGDDGGHAFICDGYQDNNYFHFNWGWDGLFNGYYTLDNLNPRTSTFNQWQSALIGIHPSEGPISNFTSNITNVLTGSSVNFEDKSIGIPTSWTWTFEGGTPSSSNDKNPQNIVYSLPGNYTVTLMTSNESGENTCTINNYIYVEDTALPIANFILPDSIYTSNDVIEITNDSYNSPTNYFWTSEPDNIIFENSTDCNSQNPNISFSEAGDYVLTLTVNNDNGENSISKTIHYGGLSLPYNEGFELSLGNTGWTVINPDSSLSWDGCYFGGGYTSGTKSIYVNCNAYSAVGERDQIISPLLNFTGLSDINLSFKHAYAQNPGHQDSLLIYISNDNGNNWNKIYAISEDGSNNFATHFLMNGRFTPETQSDWSNPTTLSLTQFSGESNIRIMFEVYNDNGNCLYLDDVQVSGENVGNSSYSVNPPTAFIQQNYPNPFYLSANRSLGTTISYSVEESQNIKIDIYNIKGEKVLNLVNEFVTPGKYNIIWNGYSESGKKISSGVYFYRMKSGNYTSTKKMILLK